MKKAFLLLSLFLFFSLSACSQPNTELKPKLLLISIDGLYPSLLQKAKQQGFLLPNFDRFLKEGSYADAVIGVFPTLTYPIHTSLMTGVSSNVHGITHNYLFEPEYAQYKNWMWLVNDIRVPTLWGQAKKAGLKTANVDWPVSIGAPVDFNIVQYWHPTKKTGHDLLQALSTPLLVASLEKKLGPYLVGDWSIEGDRQRLRFAQAIIKQYQPDFMTIYFASLDDTEHKTGVESQSTFFILRNLDTFLGQLLDTIYSTYGNQVVVALVSDHGFMPVNKSINLNTAFQKAGWIKLNKEKRLTEWDVYSLSGEGFTEIRLQKKQDYHKVLKLLQQLARDPQNGIDRIFSQPEIEKLGGSIQTDFIVTAKRNFVFRDALTGPLVDTHVNYAATHGFMPSVPEMNSCFFIMGPHIPKNKNLGTISVLDIAPTLAKLLGTDLPQAEGKNLFLEHT